MEDGNCFVSGSVNLNNSVIRGKKNVRKGQDRLRRNVQYARYAA